MTARQIRLKDDVAAWVASRQGDGSLSETANQLLRGLRDEQQRSTVAPVAPVDQSEYEVAQPVAQAPQAEALDAVFDAAVPAPRAESSAAHRVAAANYEEALGRRRRPKPARAAVTVPVAPGGICPPHPLLARRDGVCGRCGATLSDARPEAAAGR